MARQGLRKQIVTSNMPDLPKATAQRLNGFNGTLDQLVEKVKVEMVNVKVEILKELLREQFGPVSAWLPPLQRMMEGKAGLNEFEVAAVKRVIKEVNGTEV